MTCIEKSKFHKGEYIGYGKEVYKICKSGKGWKVYDFASHAADAQGKPIPKIWFKTLKEMDQFLEIENS